MTQEHLPARRGLADLDDRLTEPARRCAEHLRELRDRAGLSSEELAARLTTDTFRVDKTRLSKFFGGREVPRHAFAARIHQVLAEVEGRAVDPRDVAQTRGLIYAAARERGAIQAREFELAQAHEELNAFRLSTARQLASLHQELDAERTKRQAAEEALAALRGQAQEQAEELRQQRDAAEERVAEVEEAIRQAEALLRLKERDARTMAQLTAATEAELLLLDDGIATMDAPTLCKVLAEWRDYGHHDQADQLMDKLAAGSDSALLFEVYQTFHVGGRIRDAVRILDATAQRHDPVALFYFAKELESANTKPPASATFEEWKDQPVADRWALSRLEPRPPTPAQIWISELPKSLGAHAPAPALLAFFRVCQENNNDSLADLLRRHLQASVRREDLDLPGLLDHLGISPPADFNPPAVRLGLSSRRWWRRR